MTKIDEFLAFTINLVEEELKHYSLPRIEELSVKISIIHIFEQTYDLEEIYYALLDYCDEQPYLSNLVSEIETYFTTH